MEKTTVPCHYVKALIAAIERKGCDPIPLLEYADIPLELAADVNARIPHDNYTKLIRKGWQLLDDENFGLSSPSLPSGSFYFAGHLMIDAPNLKTALKMGIKFYKYIDCGYQITLNEMDGEVQFEAKLNKPELDPDHLLAEFIITGWHRLSSWLIGRNIVLKHVGFDFAPPAHEAEYSHMYPGPRDFNQDCLSFRFSSDYLHKPVVQNTHDMERYIRTTPKNLLLNPVDDDSYGTQIRLLIENYPGEGFPSFEDIAENLHMSSKTLRRKLKSEGITYQKIKDVIRRDLSIYYLTRQKLTTSEVAFKVGFTETSAFIRAFKKWTGLTPAAYHKK